MKQNLKDKKLNRLAATMKKIPADRLDQALVKRKMLTMRVTEADRTEIKQAAKKFGLSVTEYLTRLHKLNQG